MLSCPACRTDLEKWQIECHHCGQAVSSDAIPVIEDAEISKKDIQVAFLEWMDRGNDLLKRKSFDEAHACFAEALKRVNGLESQRGNEVKVRKKLADAFTMLQKHDEAVAHLVIAADLSRNQEEKVRLQKKIDRINSGRSSTDQEFSKKRDSGLAPPQEHDRVSALLFCVSCSRLMTEAEVYRFRSGKSEEATCICGFTGTPLAQRSEQVDLEHHISSGLRAPARKERLIEAAQKPVAGGRTKAVAFWLALCLGTFGAHKFYLGDKARGFAYVLLCWTLIPLVVSIYEAILIAQMSRVSFNLAYNIEGVLERLPLESFDQKAADEEVINMEVTEDPEDVIDEWSSEDEV